MRMIPTVLLLNPDAFPSTAKVRMAPTASRKMLTPRLKLLASRTMRRSRRCRVLLVRLSAATADMMSGQLGRPTMIGSGWRRKSDSSSAGMGRARW
jgi:hypothetical protein